MTDTENEDIRQLLIEKTELLKTITDPTQRFAIEREFRRKIMERTKGWFSIETENMSSEELYKAVVDGTMKGDNMMFGLLMNAGRGYLKGDKYFRKKNTAESLMRIIEKKMSAMCETAYAIGDPKLLKQYEQMNQEIQLEILSKLSEMAISEKQERKKPFWKMV